MFKEKMSTQGRKPLINFFGTFLFAKVDWSPSSSFPSVEIRASFYWPDAFPDTNQLQVRGSDAGNSKPLQ